MRDYGYGSGSMILGGGTTRMVKTLILINIGVFLLQIASGWKLNLIFGLSSRHVFREFMVWQFLTHMFLHGGVWHLAINMFMLWMFGRELESIWGEKGFLRYYLVCGIGGGVATYLFTMNSPVITIGASGAIFGILVAYAVIYPDRMITLLLFFFLPLTIKAKHLVMIFAGIELLQCISGAADGIGHFAHLGGGVVGYIYLKMWRKFSYYGVDYKETFLSWFRKPFIIRKQNRAVILEKEVDRILDKISKQGFQSLSWREKIILRRRAKK